ncbi:hypothetical protein ACFWAT_01900 [Streptomyces syringium]|uniref:hypothetical protein n=1 Tax=Streptomyces syringium TaxID=76729 RepID=UPI0036642C53
MRTRVWASGIALGATLLAGGITTATAQAAPTATAATGTAVAAVVPPDRVFIGYYPSSTACHIAGTSMAGENHTCIRKGSRGYALYIYV